MHPRDADERGIETGDPVAVSAAGVAVEAVAERDDDVRRGAVFLHAAVADPLLRREVSTVSVEPRSSPSD
jgi:formate dehydrogenase major subunit